MVKKYLLVFVSTFCLGIGFTFAQGTGPAVPGLGAGPGYIPGIPASGAQTTIGVGLVPMFGNYQSSGFPYLAVPTRIIIQQSTVTTTDFATLQLARTTAYTSTAGNINSNLRGTTVVGVNDGDNEWSLLGICSTATTQTTGTCVGVTGHGDRTAGIGRVWGGVFEGEDQTDLPSLSSQAVIGVELDVGANLADTAPNAASIAGTGNRAALQIVAELGTIGDTAESAFTWGTLVTTNAHTHFIDVIGSALNAAAQYVLDTRGFIAPTGSSNPVNAVAMKAGQIIEFNGPTGAGSFTNAPVNDLTYNAAGTKLQYLSAGSERFSVADNGTTIFTGASGILFTITDPGAAASQHFGLTYTSGSNTWTFGASGGTNLVIKAGGAGTVSLQQVQTIANGSVATTMTSLGPVGSHTTIQEWMAVTNPSGVTRYVALY